MPVSVGQEQQRRTGNHAYYGNRVDEIPPELPHGYAHGTVANGLLREIPGQLPELFQRGFNKILVLYNRLGERCDPGLNPSAVAVNLGVTKREQLLYGLPFIR